VREGELCEGRPRRVGPSCLLGPPRVRSLRREDLPLPGFLATCLGKCWKCVFLDPEAGVITELAMDSIYRRRGPLFDARQKEASSGTAKQIQ